MQYQAIPFLCTLGLLTSIISCVPIAPLLDSSSLSLPLSACDPLSPHSNERLTIRNNNDNIGNTTTTIPCRTGSQADSHEVLRRVKHWPLETTVNKGVRSFKPSARLDSGKRYTLNWHLPSQLPLLSVFLDCGDELENLKSQGDTGVTFTPPKECTDRDDTHFWLTVDPAQTMNLHGSWIDLWAVGP